MGILANIDPEQRRKLLRLVSIFVAIIVVVTLLVMLGRQQGAKTKTGGDSAVLQTKATLVNGSSLYGALASDARYADLGRDLAVLSKDYFKVNDGVPIFTIEKGGEGLHFFGSFNKPAKSRIEVTITNLPNERMKIVAKDTGKNKDLGEFFQSNSPLNQFIATLPITAQDYEVSYDVVSSSFVITTYDHNPDLITQAEAALKKGLNTEDLKDVKVIYLFPTKIDGDFPSPAGDEETAP